MTPVCTLDYINRPGRPAEDIIMEHVQRKNGGRVPADIVQWIRLPDKRFPAPMPPDYRHPDGITLEKIAHADEKYRLYAAYDALALRIFWMVAETRHPRGGKP